MTNARQVFAHHKHITPSRRHRSSRGGPAVVALRFCRHPVRALREELQPGGEALDLDASAQAHTRGQAEVACEGRVISKQECVVGRQSDNTCSHSIEGAPWACQKAKRFALDP